MTPFSRFCLALAASALLHLALLGGRLPPRTHAAAPPMRLDARLMVPPTPTPAPDPAILEKDTIATAEKEAEEVPRVLPAPPVSQPPATARRVRPAPAPDPRTAAQQALRKLSDYILYPPAAKAAGHEGTVHLLLRVEADGRVREVSVAASSGFPELDHAAVEAALRAGRIDAGGRSELLLPVTFRLQ